MESLMKNVNRIKFGLYIVGALAIAYVGTQQKEVGEDEA